jgi:NAD(P)-dependent dehydrogenase (short-subunit alcohol dehydrogenase family)
MEQLTDKVAFITGGASGIGLALGNIFADAGMRVVLADIDAHTLEEVAPQFDAKRLLCLRLDVTDRANWAAAKQAAFERFGAVDLLCNNAGIGPDGRSLATMAPGSFDRMIATNLTGIFNGISTFAADMQARGSGHIVNTSSMAGLMANARLGAYTAAKFAVVGMSEVLQSELAPHGVGVTVFCPGLIRTRLEETTRALGNETMTGTSMDSAMDVMEAVQVVLKAVRDNQLYAISHAEYRDPVVARLDRVLAAFPSAAGVTRTLRKIPGADATP